MPGGSSDTKTDSVRLANYHRPYEGTSFSNAGINVAKHNNGTIVGEMSRIVQHIRHDSCEGARNISSMFSKIAINKTKITSSLLDGLTKLNKDYPKN